MKKYVFMYNVDEIEKQKYKNRLSQSGVDFYFEQYSIMPTFDSIRSNGDLVYEVENEGFSLWVLEEHYLVAFTLINYEEMAGIAEYDTTVEDCLEWHDNHKDKDIFVKNK